MWTKTTSEKWKFVCNKKLGLELTMNGLGKQFRKKSEGGRVDPAMIFTK